MRYLLLLSSLYIVPAVTTAQTSLDGAWEGEMIVGGIYGTERLPVQMFITLDDGMVTGRTYIKLPDGELVQMNLTGRMYRDRSMEMVETDYVGSEDNAYFPLFNRQYQLIYKPDLFDSELQGFWQEVTEDTFNKFRKRGRMRLRKVEVKGA